MNWQKEEEVFKAKAIGEMADILIKAMGWEKDYKHYKERMFEYLKSEKHFESVELTHSKKQTK